MVIEKLIREKGSRKLISADLTFHSFKEVINYCFEYASKMKPLKDDIMLKFLILDSEEVFDVSISLDRDGLAYAQIMNTIYTE